MALYHGYDPERKVIHQVVSRTLDNHVCITNKRTADVLTVAGIELVQEDMNRKLYVWKALGETPLQAVQRAKNHFQLSPKARCCFVGRLDPMAQGVMTVLSGKRFLREKELYQKTIKTYVFQAVLGVSTVSFDALGEPVDSVHISNNDVQRFIRSFLTLEGQTISQRFPAISAYKFNDVPLWQYSKENRLLEVEPWPTAKRTVHSVKLVRPPTELSVNEYCSVCFSDMNEVLRYNKDNQFNVKEIKQSWRKLLPSTKLVMLGFQVTVSGGTFVRGLVNDIGAQLGIPAHAFRITRTAVNPKHAF